MIRHFSLAFAFLPLCVCLAVEQEKEMADNDIDNAADLLDYDEEENTTEAAAQNDAGGAENATKKQVKGSYVSIHSSGFRDFLLKPELLRAIVDCGFEHPSEGLPPPPRSVRDGVQPFSLSLTVQDECIPQAILGMDVVCQAKSGMGKTAVFVIATLQQLEPTDGQVSVIVMCHTR